MKKQRKFTWKKFWRLIWPILLFIAYAFCQELSLKLPLVAVGISAVLGLVLIKYNFNKTTQRQLKHPVRSSILLILGSLIAIFLINICYQAILQQFSITIPLGDNQKILNQLGKKNLMSLAFLTILIGPVFEEGIFRLGFISFKNKNWTIISSCFSALLFALVHVSGTWNVWVFGEYLIISIIFTLLYVYTRDMRYSLALHVSYNTLVFLAILAML